MTVKTSMNAKLIAACGMNCAICLAFLREKNRCEGCWSPTRKCNKNCTIGSCVHRQGKFCFKCDSFPCKRLLQLDSRYRKKYGMSMIENLELIHSEGIRNFIRTEKNRWTCSACGRTICVHRGCCFSCGVKKDKDVFLQKSNTSSCKQKKNAK